jgi:hypothetical protein
VDGLPTWVRWLIVAVVGLSPILSFWMAGVIRQFLRRNPRRRPETRSQSEDEHGATHLSVGLRQNEAANGEPSRSSLASSASEQ